MIQISFLWEEASAQRAASADARAAVSQEIKMGAFSLVPEAKRITAEEKDAYEFNDHVIGFRKHINMVIAAVYLLLGSAVLSVLAAVIVNFLPLKMQNKIDAFYDRHNDLFEKGSLLFIFGTVIFALIGAYITDLKIVVSDGRIVELASRNPKTGKSMAPFLYTGVGGIIVFSMVSMAVNGETEGKPVLFWFIMLLFIGCGIKNLIVPFLQKIILNKRKRTCTLPVAAQFGRYISTWSAEDDARQQFGSLPVYTYCCDGQYYRMIISSSNNIPPDNYETIEIMVDPAAPQKYYSDMVFIRNFGKARAFLAFLFVPALVTLPIWGVLLFRLIVDIAV